MNFLIEFAKKKLIESILESFSLLQLKAGARIDFQGFSNQTLILKEKPENRYHPASPIRNFIHFHAVESTEIVYRSEKGYWNYFIPGKVYFSDFLWNIQGSGARKGKSFDTGASIKWMWTLGEIHFANEDEELTEDGICDLRIFNYAERFCGFLSPREISCDLKIEFFIGK